jgi:hypothetical protein
MQADAGVEEDDDTDEEDEDGAHAKDDADAGEDEAENKENWDEDDDEGNEDEEDEEEEGNDEVDVDKAEKFTIDNSVVVLLSSCACFALVSLSHSRAFTVLEPWLLDAYTPRSLTFKLSYFERKYVESSSRFVCDARNDATTMSSLCA